MANNPNPSYFDYVAYDWTAAQELINQGVKLSKIAKILDPTGTVLSKKIIFVAVNRHYLKMVHFYDGIRQPFVYPSATVPILTTDNVDVPNPFNPVADFYGTIVSDGGSPITERGFAFSNDSEPKYLELEYCVASGTSIGEYSAMNIDVSTFAGELNYLRAYAVNGIGVGYGNVLTFTPNICLVEGTKVKMTNGLLKAIEEISYDDSILVWNFDEGKFDSSKPVWIKIPQTASEYNLITFSDGSSVKTISQHRIFNKEKGMFTYPMTDETPIGTTTYNSKGEFVKVVDKKVIKSEVKYYNVITDKHINLFADSILTSCRLNNMYTIENMKFNKVNGVNVYHTKEEFTQLSQEMFDGLRISEQSLPTEILTWYVNRLLKHQLQEEYA